jgi:hypothetical protein
MVDLQIPPRHFYKKNPPITLPPCLIPPNPNSPPHQSPDPSLSPPPRRHPRLSCHRPAPYAPRCRPAPCSPPWACGGGSGLPVPPLRLPRIPRAAAALLSPSMPPLSTCFRFSMVAAVAPALLPLWEADRPSPGAWHHRVLLSPPFLPRISDPVPICTFLMGCYFRRARA